MKNYRERVCEICGSVFEPISPRQKTCCKECSDILTYGRGKAYKQKMSIAKRKTEPEEDIFTIAKKASKMGLTYGQYMTKKGYK